TGTEARRLVDRRETVRHPLPGGAGRVEPGDSHLAVRTVVFGPDHVWDATDVGQTGARGVVPRASVHRRRPADGLMPGTERRGGAKEAERDSKGDCQMEPPLHPD